MHTQTDRPTPTGRERCLGAEELIVSKTDLTGRITYANDVFQRIAGYSERELLGAPHSIVRHPDMPRCVFRLLWKVIESQSEIFAYVKNLAKNGDHYWVFAHVSPSFALDGQWVGYHSSRRAPERGALERIAPIYAALLAEEQRHASPLAGIEASTRILQAKLGELGLSYGEFAFSL